jgi:hypothetical protein
MAYVLMGALRRIRPCRNRLWDATCGTIRPKLLKIGALVRVSVRRIKLAMASAPRCQDWSRAARRLRKIAGDVKELRASTPPPVPKTNLAAPMPTWRVRWWYPVAMCFWIDRDQIRSRSNVLGNCGTSTGPDNETKTAAALTELTSRGRAYWSRNGAGPESKSLG